ncbi:MAG: EAL domain-containing protein [Vulcanimicrobiota bacterium]
MKRSGGKEPIMPEASQEELASLVQRAVGTFAVVGEDGVTRYINPPAARLLKKKPDKLVGEPFPYPLEEGSLRDVDAELKIEPTSWNGEDCRLVTIKSLKASQAAFHIEWRIESAEERARDAEEKIKQLEARLAELAGGSEPSAQAQAPAVDPELASQLEDARQQISQLEEALEAARLAAPDDDLRAQLEKAKAKAVAADQRVEELENLLDEAEHRVQEAEGRATLESHEFSTELQDALSQCRDLEQQVQDAEERARDALERVHMAESLAEEAEERAYEAEGLLEVAENRAEEAEARLEELEQALEEAASLSTDPAAVEELEGLNSRVKELEKELKQVREATADESSLLQELEELRAGASRLTELEAELEGLRPAAERVKALEAELEAAKNEAGHSEVVEAEMAELREAAARAAELEVELEQFRDLSADFEALREAAEQAELLEAEVQELREVADQVVLLQGELESAREQAGRADALEAEVEELKLRLESAQEEVQASQEQLAAVPAVDPEMAQKVVDLEAELNRARAQLDRANELLGDPEQMVKLERQLEGAIKRAADAEERAVEAQSILEEVKRASVARVEELTEQLERVLAGAAAAPAGGEGGTVDPETERLAFQDSLTGLPNVNIIKRYLDFMLKQAERYNRATALLSIDLDRFKMVNDALGNKVGDELLCLVAERLSAVVRGSDVLGRRGEDEFIILLSELSGQEEATSMAAAVARRVYEVLEPPFSVQDQKVFIGCSIAISLYPSDARTAEQMFIHADTAMERAKQLGRGRYQFFTPDLQEISDIRSRLDVEIRRGLEENQFQLVYQPIFNLMTGRMAGVESLVRWNHPASGVVGPDEFLEAAENTGLIVPIGRWAILQAIEQASRWQKEGLGLFTSINVSRRQLLQADLAATILRSIEVTGASPGSIVLEFDEALNQMDSPRIRENLEELRKAGLKFAVDRFGSGYSSLEVLNTDHHTMIKIDRKFTKGVPDDHRSTSIVLAAMSLARNLNMTSVVVGIENKQQKQLLMRLECQLGQGNFLSEPIEAAMVSQIADRVFT